MRELRAQPDGEASPLNPAPTIARYDLRGPVRRLSALSRTTGPPETCVDKLASFDEQGLLLESEEWFRGNGAQHGYKTNFRYQHLCSRLLDIHWERLEGGPREFHLTEYCYDDWGRLTTVRETHQGEEPRVRENFQHREDGSVRMRRHTVCAPNGLVPWQRVPNGRQLYRPPTGTTIETEFNPSGLPCWSLLSGEHGEAFAVLSDYDEDRLVEEYRIALACELPCTDARADWPGVDRRERLGRAALSRARYEYDRQGRLVRTELAAGGIVVREIKLTRNERGDVVLEESVWGDQREDSSRFELEYDQVGNWIRRRRAKVAGTETTLAAEEIRTIAYFSAPG